MKNTSALMTLLILAVLPTFAQITQIKQADPNTIKESVYAESERGAHHKVWERIEYEPTMDGKVAEHRRSYQELATGLHYREGDQWLESEAKIEILPNNAGAAASKGQHKAIFPPEIKSGLIELQTPDGQWLRSRVWGLAYFDASTGESVLLAEVQESEGQIMGDNVVVYPNAFTDFLADIRYTYTLAGFEQDVVLREQPPAPSEFGLNPKTTRLQALTEFVEAQTPVKSQRSIGGLTDESLGFGGMNIGLGKAFSINAEGAAVGHVPVSKTWIPIEGRNYLIEEVFYEKVSGQLQKLPKVQTYEGASLQRRGRGDSALAGLKNLLPKRYAKAVPKPTDKPRRMAKAVVDTRPSFVMDYVTLSSQTNFTFKSDTTYYVNGTLYLAGITTFEGGTVLKYATNASVVLNVDYATGGPHDDITTCHTDSYRPVVLTSKDDNSIGETISGSSGNPVHRFANPALYFNYSGTDGLRNFRIACAKTAVKIDSDYYAFPFTDLQILNSVTAFELNHASVEIYNALLFNLTGSAFAGEGANLQLENMTVHNVNQLANVGSVDQHSLKNCLLVGVTNWGNLVFTTNASTVTNDQTVFRTAGGGSHYLADSSPYRDIGTTNINLALLKSLAKKTTYPPVAYTNTTFTTPQTFNPQAQRDIDTPDLGYHYDPLDYTFGGCHANSNITFTAGTAVGWFRYSSGWNHAGQGIHFGDKQVGTFDGTVTAPCYWVRLTTVQEQDRTAGYGPGGLTGWAANLANAPDVKARFTRFSMMAGDGNHVRDDNGWLNVRAQDSEFFNGGAGGYVISMYFTNCLFSRMYLAQVDGNGPCGVVLRNCTMIGNLLQFVPSASYASTYKIWDCAFDGTSFQFSGPAANATYAAYDYNAYTNATRPFPSGVSGPHDVIVSSGFNWQTNWLGNYYLPTNSTLINTGSVTSPNIALYHFTTQTDQAREATSQVDIGYHYVALDSEGLPWDIDGNTVADYAEDTNQNGIPNGIETLLGYDPAANNSLGNLTTPGYSVWLAEPKPNTKIP